MCPKLDEISQTPCRQRDFGYYIQWNTIRLELVPTRDLAHN